MAKEMYVDGEYLEKNPTWHVEDSPWKAGQIMRMIERNDLDPRTVCEVGCGAGEILRQLQIQMADDVVFWGYEISPEAFELCRERANERLHFRLGNILEEEDARFELVLLIDVIEHLESYFEFLRAVRSRGKHLMLHVPLDLSVRALLRRGELERTWDMWGHVHHFTKGLALKALDAVGYHVVDYFYASKLLDEPPHSVRAALLRPAKRLFRRIFPDLAVRVMGGFSLMVLAE